jgi:hypothetical protein
VLLLTGRTAEAIAEYEAALQINPDDAAALANLHRAQVIAESAGGRK